MIKFLLKFGERQYLERLRKGHLYFSHALNFRQYEETLLMKGQGDRLEGSSLVAAQDFTFISHDTGNTVMSGAPSNLLVHYEPANLLPVYCMFAGFDKDCVIDKDGTLSIRLSAKTVQAIISHFPKADAVAIVKNPLQFINDVHASIGEECVADLVHYFHLHGFESKEGTANDLDYYKYLSQDTPPRRINGQTVHSFNSKYTYRCLLCKDVYFEDEQEFRFILPKRKISEAMEFDFTTSEIIEMQDLSTFFSNVIY